ncbi:hypothetical protein VNO77_47728 [Canavalia gladiata]|uniref:Uncharacterized protein n=1 Tax=Canavalia gladiata TaxID=3824 RepID=A0AAN9JER8_CANGL
MQLKHEINVESTIIERGTAKRDRDQHLQEDARQHLKELTRFTKAFSDRGSLAVVWVELKPSPIYTKKCYLLISSRNSERQTERQSYLLTPRMRSRSLVFGRKSSLLPLGRVSLLSELAGRGDRLINMNLESGWLTAAPLSWRLSGRGGACYRNLFSRNLVRSIHLLMNSQLRQKRLGGSCRRSFALCTEIVMN